MAGTSSYIIPRLTRAGQINLNTNTEPRSLSDLINFTQKSNLVESQLAPLTFPFGDQNPSWVQALRTFNHYFGTSQIYKEGCTNYSCPGGRPVPRDVETANITVGINPSGLAVNPTTNLVYVANQGPQPPPIVTVINATSNSVLTTIPVGGSPNGVGVDPKTNFVYVSNAHNGLAVINGTSNTLYKTIAIGGYGVAVNPITHFVYVANTGVVSVINGTSNTLYKTITLATGSFAFGIGVNPTGNRTTNRVYVSDFLGGPVTVINGTSNTILTTINLGTGINSFGVGVNPSTNRAYIGGLFNVYVIDGITNNILATIPARGLGVDVNPNNNRVYARGLGGTLRNAVSVINGTSNTVINTVTVGTGEAYLGVAVDPTNPCPPPLSFNSCPVVYVTNSGENTVSVIGQREEIWDACLQAITPPCIVVSSIGTLFPTAQQPIPVSLIAVSLRSNETKIGTQMALTVVCDNKTTNPNQQCSAFYVDGNVWGPGQTDLTKSPFIIQNAEPYFYLQFHWWDFANSRIFAWGTWWYGTASNPNWFWGVYWSWRTYVNYYVGIPYIPWWWWQWHWTYWQYWGFWGTVFQT